MTQEAFINLLLGFLVGYFVIPPLLFLIYIIWEEIKQYINGNKLL